MYLVHIGTYGGGKPKPFRYTEVQRHRFQLKSKEGTADRQVPLMPLSFTNAKARTSAIITGRPLNQWHKRVENPALNRAKGGNPRYFIILCTVIRFVWVSAKFGTCTVMSVKGHLLKLKCAHSPSNLRIFSSTRVPFTFTTVQVPNLVLTHKKRLTVCVESAVS